MADQFYYETVLAMPMDGANGSTTFNDYSPRHTTFAAPNGGGAISNAQSKFGGTSLSFNGASAYLQPNAWGLNIGSAPFTIECWVYFNNLTGIQGIFSFAFGNLSAPVLRK